MVHVNSLVIAKHFAAQISNITPHQYQINFGASCLRPGSVLHEREFVDLKFHFTYHEMKTH